MPEIFTREQLPSAPVEEPTPIRISDQYPEATALIRKYESVNQSGQPHLNPYKDSGGNWTVGN